MSFAPAACHFLSAAAADGLRARRAGARAHPAYAGQQAAAARRRWLSGRPQRAEPGRTRIGWIGLGVMGASMCGAPARRGLRGLTATTRTRAKAEPLLARGVAWAATPREVAEQSDVVFSMVGFPRDVREVVLGRARRAGGAARGRRPRRHDHERAGARASRSPRRRARAAPSRSTRRSRAATSARARRGSRSWSAATRRRSTRCMPCLERLGRTIVHQGGPGAGQHAKLVNQTLIAANMVGVCEALLYAYRAGLDLEAVLRSVGVGRRGQLVAREPRAAHAGRRLRAGLLRRALRQGHGHRARGGGAHGRRDAGARAGAHSSTWRWPRRATRARARRR